MTVAPHCVVRMVEFTIVALKRPFQSVGPGPSHRFHLSGAKTADFFEFAISEESHRPRRLASVLRNSSKSYQGRGTGGSNSVRSANESRPV